MAEDDSKPDLASVKNDPVLDLLQREYWALQDKIDKIGGFRFTIKGWALTLNTGALVAAFATSLNPKVGVLLVSALVFGLWSLEWGQSKLTDLFQGRTLRIETKIARRLNSLGVGRLEFSTLICSPGIASELRTPIDIHRPDKAAASPLRRKKGVLHQILNIGPIVRFRRSNLSRKLRSSDVYFYVLLWIISVAFIALQHSHTPQVRKEQSPWHVFKLMSFTEPPESLFTVGGAWRDAER